MSIQLSSVHSVGFQTPVKSSVGPEAKIAPAAESEKPDSVSLNQSTPGGLTYADPRSKADEVSGDEAERLVAMLDEADRRVEEFMAFLRPLLKEQGLAIDKVVRGEQRLTIDAATIAKAKADVAEDGEFGVRRTAERILNFAKLGMRGDPEKIETFRAAIQKGFDEARAILGGSLPEISEQTHAAIMAELDRWAKDGIPQGEVGLGKQTAEDAGESG